MNTIELLSIIIASIATILGGVWFIVNQAFNFGKTTQRINQIDERTAHAKCDSHDDSIELLKKQLYEFKRDIQQSIDNLRNDFNDFKRETRENFKVVKEDISNLKVDVASLKKDVAILKVDVATLKVDVASLKKEVFSIKEFLSLKYEDALAFFLLKNSPLSLSEFGKFILQEIDGMELIQRNKDILFSAIDNNKPRTALDVESSALMACISFCDNEEFDKIKNFVYNSPEYDVKDKNGDNKKCNLRLADVCFILSIPLRDLYLSQHPEITL